MNLLTHHSLAKGIDLKELDKLINADKKSFFEESSIISALGSEKIGLIKNIINNEQNVVIIVDA